MCMTCVYDECTHLEVRGPLLGVGSFLLSCDLEIELGSLISSFACRTIWLDLFFFLLNVCYINLPLSLCVCVRERETWCSCGDVFQVGNWVL